RSDLVVETVSLPIGTYPSAIKAIVPLIDDGLWLEARQALQAALDSLVVTEVIYPLPILRAEHMLARAEDLTENVERNDEQSDQLLRLLRGARREIKLAEALGYGTPDTLKAFHLELDEIVKKTNLGDSGKGFFDKIKSKVHDLLGGNPSE
ncbi:MAG TPA: YfdX family protein, partial [Planctomycetaceae bacterium]|nr:YfdX family protein [Planctomycetaceae bacterium]